ncbi:hypothetical protein [Curtobacterium sp. VKM Ac-2887]|uniref:hypothetical protein n=1 Tax=Curtobacterium sp. VKM Ac-2887 TaxID=2783819 RepID=UPI00188C3E0D|nr:hypothetical protein [Curtobacterium sp. VKM Ac-2887]MBF4587780.1 hypothetical protein [Curtobacterium sp. VKM Ac-2887]
MLRVLGAFAAAAIALLLGFAVQGAHDTQSMATIRSALTISHAGEDAPTTKLLRAEATDLRANFYQVRIDPTGRTPTRTLAPVIGDRITHERVFPSGSYAAFDTSLTTELTQAPSSPLGTYFSTLPPRALEAVSDRLAIAGVDTHVEAMSWGGLALYLLGYTPLVMAAAVVGGASWLAGRVRGLAQVRAQAVLRVHGVLGPFVRDITASVLVASAAFVISAGPAILLVHAYNGGHQLWSYLAISAVLLGGFLTAFIVGASGPGLLPRGVRFRPAFSSWRPWLRGRVTMAAAQVATLTLVVFLIAQGSAAWTSLAVVRASGPDWRGCSACTVTIFNGFDGQSALDDAVRPFSSSVRASERKGEVVLSWVRGAVRGNRFSPGDSESNVILANPTFVARSGGGLPDPLHGKDGPGEWGLLVPSDHADRAESIADEWLEAFREPLGTVPNQSAPKRPHIATYPAGRVFNYGQTGFRNEVYSESPVIVVASGSAGLLDDESYFAAGSSGDLLFTGGPRETQQALDTAGVERSVYSLDSLGTQIARGTAAAQSKLVVSLVSAAAGLVALLGMLTIGARMDVARRRDQLLVLRAHGEAPARVHLVTAPRSLAFLASTGVAALAAGTSGLLGADIPTGTLVTVGIAVSVVVLVTNAFITTRLTTTKGLTTDER